MWRWMWVVLGLLCGVAQAQTMEMTLAPVGGAYRMFNRPTPTAGAAVEPVALKLQIKNLGDEERKVRVTLSAEDIFGKPVDWKRDVAVDLPEKGKTAEQEVSFSAGIGYFRIRADAVSGAEKATAVTDVGVVPPFHPGVRPDSFFASNTSRLRRGEQLRFLQAIGVKVQRAHFQPRLMGPAPAVASGAALSLDFAEQDKAWKECREAGLWVLPIVGYAFDGTKSKQAIDLKMHGPPRDFAEFVNTWEQILRRYPEITTVEFWNEPWIFGWTWADTPAAYRRLQTMWCQMALRVNPRYRIIVGNSSMFTEDHIEHDPSCWQGLAAGTSHHPYSFSTSLANLRAGDVGRTVDHGMQVTRRMNLPHYYVTEGGTSYPENAKNNNQNAAKIVQYFVRTALVGAFQGNAQWEIGYGPGWTRSNTAFAVMTHFLEDRPVVADIWPEHELLFGAIFANPRHVTDEVKALPRAGELTARWDVAVPEERAGDATKVAVIWSLTGESNQKLDDSGTLTIDEVGDLKAYDLVGRQMPLSEGKLVLPLGQYPVYVTSEALSVVELRRKIAAARIERVTAVNLYALSLAEAAIRPQKMMVRVENQVNCDVKGVLSLSIDGLDAGATEFAVAAGKLVEIPVLWPGVKPAGDNQYRVALTATVMAADGSKRAFAVTKKSQVLGVARFAKRGITVDGSLDDWLDVTPAVIDSELVGQGADETASLLNPNLPRPSAATRESNRIVARVYAAYDDGYVYIGAEVNEPELRCTAGEPWREGTPQKRGVPEGLDYVSNCGDVLQFAFGFRDRVPGWGRQMNDPYAWKGQFYDTDYQYAAHVSQDGDKLVRQWGPDTPRRTAYQTERVPGVGPVAGAAIRITRDEARKLTTYEIGIPRGELAMFDPGKLERLRFGFVLSNNERLGINGLNWGEAAGVFDHWACSGSYGPSWTARVPCQTFFGIEK